MAVGIDDLSEVWIDYLSEVGIDTKNPTERLKYRLAGTESVGGACDTFSQQFFVRRQMCGRETARSGG